MAEVRRRLKADGSWETGKEQQLRWAAHERQQEAAEEEWDDNLGADTQTIQEIAERQRQKRQRDRLELVRLRQLGREADIDAARSHDRLAHYVSQAEVNQSDRTHDDSKSVESKSARERPWPEVDDEDEEEDRPRPQENPSQRELPSGLYVGLEGAERLAKLCLREGKAEAATPLPEKSEAIRKRGTPSLVDEGGRKPYWIQVDSWLLERPDLSLGAKLLFAWLVNGTKLKKGKPVAPSQSHIANQLGTSLYQVGSLTKELVEAGLIKCERRGARNPNRYTVLSK
jgi:hypothetical protein